MNLEMKEEKGICAQLLLDSLSPSGHRLTTWILKYPRFIHAEFMTHRQFSRNASSSRAIPTHRLMKKVIKDPAMPVWWGKNQKGMQAREEVNHSRKVLARNYWINARNGALRFANYLDGVGVHKQIVNRLMEPWMHITVVMSTTTLSNWFALRAHPDAQPEIADLAYKMKEIYESEEPKRMKAGEWHLPFVTDDLRSEYDVETLKKISTARCARVSYLTHDGEINIEKDIALHDYLAVQCPKHASPTEHQAMALNKPVKIGNFTGWCQYRKLIKNEVVESERYE